METFMAAFHTVGCLPYQVDHTSFKERHHKSLREPLEFFTYSCYNKNLNANKRMK